MLNNWHDNSKNIVMFTQKNVYQGQSPHYRPNEMKTEATIKELDWKFFARSISCFGVFRNVPLNNCLTYVNIGIFKNI